MTILPSVYDPCICNPSETRLWTICNHLWSILWLTCDHPGSMCDLFVNISVIHMWLCDLFQTICDRVWSIWNISMIYLRPFYGTSVIQSLTHVTHLLPNLWLMWIICNLSHAHMWPICNLSVTNLWSVWSIYYISITQPWLVCDPSVTTYEASSDLHVTHPRAIRDPFVTCFLIHMWPICDTSVNTFCNRM